MITVTWKSRLQGHRSSLVAQFLALLIAVIACCASALAHRPAIVDEDSRFAVVDGMRVHYNNYGEGPEALVLIHGWSCSFDSWREQIPDFARRSRVLAVDLPGHGQSDKPEVKYTMDLFARAVEAIMRDAKVGRAVFIAHSMGVPVARQFYRKYPQKTLAIVMIDGGLRPFGSRETVKSFVDNFRGPGHHDYGVDVFTRIAGPQFPPEPLDRIKMSLLATPQHVMLSAMESINDESIYGPDKINVPVLVILAKAPVWLPDTEEFLHTLAPHLEFQMWEGVGHFLMMEKPNEVNEVIFGFLRKNALLK